MKTKPQLLLHPIFILSLICLLVNDIYWKYEYHNWLTGKLSDFTGLFVLSVFVSAFFYKYRSYLCLPIAVFFIWWKTPLSQSLIDLLNQSLPATFHRTVDYTDYIALPAILAARIINIPAYRFSLIRKMAVYFISAVCLVAFCSTSILRKFTIYPDFSKRITYNNDYPTRLTHAEILHRLDSLGWDHRTDSVTITPIQFYGGTLLIRRRDSLDKNLMVINPNQQDTLMFVEIPEWRPYIAIHNFKAGSEVFPQVNITVQHVARTTTITLKSVFLNDSQMEDYRYEKPAGVRKKFRRLLEKELISKLK